MKTKEQINEENRILLRAEEMGAQSLSPEEFEKLQNVLSQLRERRHLKVSLDDFVSRMCQCPECINLMTREYRIHTSDCAVHNMPAEPKGECSCEQPIWYKA